MDLMLRRRQMMMSEGGGGGYFHFQDQEVERIIIQNIGDGTGVTLQQIQACTSIGTWFKNNTTITTFDEFEEFTGITEIGDGNMNYSVKGGTFSGCKNLVSLKLPRSCTKITFSVNGPFYNCESLESLDLSNVTTISRYYDSANAGCVNCKKLKTVIYNNAAQLTLCHQNNLLLELDSLPTSITELIKRNFNNCPKITIHEIPATVTRFRGDETYGGAFSIQKSSIPYMHLLPTTPPVIDASHPGNMPFYNTTFKLYVGDGSSESHDNAILADYLADSKWANYSSRLDTWYNYLQSQ